MQHVNGAKDVIRGESSAAAMEVVDLDTLTNPVEFDCEYVLYEAVVTIAQLNHYSQVFNTCMACVSASSSAGSGPLCQELH